ERCHFPACCCCSPHLSQVYDVSVVVAASYTCSRWPELEQFFSSQHPTPCPRGLSSPIGNPVSDYLRLDGVSQWTCQRVSFDAEGYCGASDSATTRPQVG